MAKTDLPNTRKARYAVRFGFRIGEGSYRRVYKALRSRWVYKVDIDTWSDGEYGNTDEYAAYLALKVSGELPEGVKLPEMHKVGKYLAAEYIEGYHPDNWCTPASEKTGKAWHDPRTCKDKKNCWAPKLNGVPVADLHKENVIIARDGTVYIIDIGHGTW